MKNILSLASAFLMAAVLAAPLSAPLAAEAKTPVVIVIDVNRIMTESSAAKNLREQVNSLRTQLKSDVDSKEKALRATQEDFLRQKDTLKPEDIAAKQKDFETRVVSSRKEIDSRVANLDRAVAAAQGTIQKKLEEILFAMAQEQKANLVLPKAAILVAEKSMDFTDEAMDRVNKALPSVKVDASAAANAPAATSKPAAKK